MQRVLLTVLHLVLFASGQEDLVDSLEADWEDGEWDSREGRFSFPRYLSLHSVSDITECQGGRAWQPFVGSKNGHENFRQARIYNFRVKCVVFARNRKFAKLTQYAIYTM